MLSPISPTHGLVKDIPFEEKKKFLESKLTEEEIGEVMRRYNDAIKNGGVPTAS